LLCQRTSTYEPESMVTAQGKGKGKGKTTFGIFTSYRMRRFFGTVHDGN